MDSHAETQGGVRVHSWMADPKMPGNRRNMKKHKRTKEGHISGYAWKDGNQGGLWLYLHITSYNYSQSTVCFTKQFFSHQIWTWSMINLPLVVFPLCGLVHLWVAKGIAETAEHNTELCAGSGEVRWGSAGSCSKVRVPTGYENKL